MQDGRVFKNPKPGPGAEAENRTAAAAGATEALNNALGPLSEEARIKKGNDLGFIMNLNGTLHNHSRDPNLFIRGHVYFPFDESDRPCTRPGGCIGARRFPWCKRLSSVVLFGRFLRLLSTVVGAVGTVEKRQLCFST